MKRLLIIAVLMLSLLAVGCDWFAGTTTTEIITTTTARDTSARELLFDIADEFRGVLHAEDYEDLEYTEDLDEEIIVGYADLLKTDRGKTEIDLMLAGDNKTVMVSLYFDTSDSLHTNVYEMEIIYVDTLRDIYVEVHYCYQGNLLHGYMDNYILDFSYTTLAEGFQSIVLEDIEWLLNELGYPVIETEGTEVV